MGNEKNKFNALTLEVLNENKQIYPEAFDYAGAELDSILPPTSRRKGAREAKKQTVLQKIRNIVEIFIGI